MTKDVLSLVLDTKNDSLDQKHVCKSGFLNKLAERMTVFPLYSVTSLLVQMDSERRYWTRVSITASPPVELRLQQSDGVFQRLVPLLLFLPLALPLLGCQLHVQGNLVLDRLRPERTQKTIVPLVNRLQCGPHVVRLFFEI